MKELFGIIRTQIKVLLRKPPIVLTGRKLLKAATQINKLVYKKHLKRNSSETQILSQIQLQDRLQKYYRKLSNKLSNNTFKGSCY